jgi:2-polyprenyl-3-methyl-5-hydroxy-6-metoxy-1,4-benzoquinol methylase
MGRKNERVDEKMTNINIPEDITETEAWADNEHAQVFDYLHNRPKYFLRRHYESFNEGRLLSQKAPFLKGNSIYEIGCATGELYRYLSAYHKQFEYTGFDISRPAISRAKSKYPNANFKLLEDNHESLVDKFGKASVVWCRDVVLHQENPYEFLERLINLTEEALILRLRTREKGETLLDVNHSCQFHWDRHWVPYIVLNTNELLDFLGQHKQVSEIIVARRFEVLGGHNFRYLPKELYEKDTGTAETALFIKMGTRQGDKPLITYSDRQDMPTYNYLERAIMKLINSL